MSTETVLVDATTLIGLAAVGQFDLLRTRFGVVHIVEQVWNEVAESPPDLPGVAELKQAVADGWCRRIRLPQANVVSMALGPARGTEARRQAAYRDRHRVKHELTSFAIVQASGHSSEFPGGRRMLRGRNLRQLTVAWELRQSRRRAGYLRPLWVAEAHRRHVENIFVEPTPTTRPKRG